MPPRVRHIITGEYPPQTGGVSDYTELVANGLVAAGDEVHVWVPKCDAADCSSKYLQVHRLPDHFGPRALAFLSRALRASTASSILVQYVPHAFGMKAMNVPFCLWLSSLRHRDVTLMFHEVMFPLYRGQRLKHRLLGSVTRVMARLACLGASRIMVASANWEAVLRGLGATAPISWMPVPSNIPVVDDPAATRAFRQRYTASGSRLLGHFSRHSDYSIERLSELVPPLLAADVHLSMVLVGVNSIEAHRRLTGTHSGLSDRLHATGVLAPREISCALSACDLMIQPYSDGISARRTTAMAAMAHGRAIATNRGGATEALWENSGAVAMAASDDPLAMRTLVGETLAMSGALCAYAHAAAELYERRFALCHTIDALMAA